MARVRIVCQAKQIVDTFIPSSTIHRSEGDYYQYSVTFGATHHLKCHLMSLQHAYVSVIHQSSLYAVVRNMWASMKTNC